MSRSHWGYRGRKRFRIANDTSTHISSCGARAGPCANITTMYRKACACIALTALLAALIPRGLAPPSSSVAGSCCCSGNRCAMAAGSGGISGHCHGAGSDSSRHWQGCGCSVSQDPPSAIPPRAFRFNLQTAAVAPLSLVASELSQPNFLSPDPLTGYPSPPDQPPRA